MGKIVVVNFPEIGEGVVEGEIIEWRKNVGDVLALDEPVVVVMTDKATVELPSPYSGVLKKCYFPVGGVAIRDKPLYEVELHENQVPKDSKAVPAHDKKIEAVPTNAPETKFVEKKDCSQGVLATPKVRDMAKNLDISLDAIEGTGKDGRITAQDLQKKAPETHESSKIWTLPNDETVPLLGIRGLMAKKMAEANNYIPHFSYFEEADATRLMQLRENTKPIAEHEEIHLTYMPFFIKALSLCIKKFPLLNSSFDVDNWQMVIHHQQNIGIAMATPAGLIVPVLKEVELMSLETLIRHYEELVQKARKGKLVPADMKEGTITISNFGSIGRGQWATPIINYPEVAILGIGAIHKQPIVKNEEINIGFRINFSWSFDHRVIDGELAAQISKSFCGYIENPAVLL